MHERCRPRHALVHTRRPSASFALLGVMHAHWKTHARASRGIETLSWVLAAAAVEALTQPTLATSDVTQLPIAKCASSMLHSTRLCLRAALSNECCLRMGVMRLTVR